MIKQIIGNLTIVGSTPKIFYVGESNGSKRDYCFKAEMFTRRFYNDNPFYINFINNNYPFGVGYTTPEGNYYKDNRRIVTGSIPNIKNLSENDKKLFENTFKIGTLLEGYSILRIHYNSPQYENHSISPLNTYIVTKLMLIEDCKTVYNEIIFDVYENKKLKLEELEISEKEVNEYFEEQFT